MDPVTAFQVAASVVTFIDFTRTLVSDARSVYKSPDGRKASVVTMSEVAEHVEFAIAEIEKHISSTSPTNLDNEILSICRECRGIGSDLQSVVATLTARGPTRIKYAKSSFVVAAKGLWKDGQVDSLTGQLDELRSRLTLALLTSVW